MLLIPCPWCGDRDETEFRYGGQAHVAFPAEPESLDDPAWAGYLFMRDNPKGWFAERWAHAQGCRRWFNVRRHTVTYEITHEITGEIAGENTSENTGEIAGPST